VSRFFVCFTRLRRLLLCFISYGCFIALRLFHRLRLFHLLAAVSRAFVACFFFKILNSYLAFARTVIRKANFLNYPKGIARV
jgi:hypothetical protein